MAARQQCGGRQGDGSDADRTNGPCCDRRKRIRRYEGEGEDVKEEEEDKHTLECRDPPIKDIATYRPWHIQVVFHNSRHRLHK